MLRHVPAHLDTRRHVWARKRRVSIQLVGRHMERSKLRCRRQKHESRVERNSQFRAASLNMLSLMGAFLIWLIGCSAALACCLFEMAKFHCDPVV
ncbi:MAG: hypothetical protein GY820_12400 [Gammaproteobacteria bacterium]|nr:hypothetical protein [Gammaproteobacteria bacterium]